MDILVLLRVLWQKKWYLLLIPILSLVATYFFTSGLLPRYISTATLSTGFTTDDQIKITEERLNLRDSEVKFNNLIQTINSESVLTLLSYRLIISDLSSKAPFRISQNKEGYQYVLPENERLKAMSIYQQKLDSMQLLSSFDPYENQLIQVMFERGYLNWQLKDDIQVKRIKDTDFITVQFSSENPLLSAFVVNALSEEYIRYDNSLKTSRSDQSVTFFEKLAKEKKRALDEKADFLSKFKMSNGVVNFSVESSTKMTQITEYELRKEQLLNDIQRLSISLASINRKLKEFQEGNDGSNDQATINSSIITIREKIKQLNDEYIKTGSTNQDLANTIKELRYQLQVETSKLSQTASSSLPTSKKDLLDQKEKYELELQIANANLTSVNNMIGSLRGSVSGQASKEATISELQREVDKASEEYLQAMNRFNIEQSKSLISSSSVRVIVKGQPNGHAEVSKRYLIIAFSAIVSFTLCAFVIISLEFLDVRVKNATQFKKIVKMPLIGTVNSVDSKNLNLTNLFSNENKNPQLEVFKHFLRKLRFEVESSPSEIILVTSTKPGEGKTFMILCLAYSLSLLKKKVLIIDTNFKHNSLTRILLPKNVGSNNLKLKSGGFVKGLIGSGDPHEMTEEDLDSSIISATGYKGINIIGNNGGDDSPSEILANRDFKSVLLRLREDFDYIFLEGPALNNFSDTRELQEYVDKVLSVFSAESAINHLDKDSIDYLKNLNGKLLGAVLNKINIKELSS